MLVRGEEGPEGVLLIFSSWPRTGSSNIFLAQARFYTGLGFQVRVLLASQIGWPTAQHVAYWTEALSGSSAAIQIAQPPWERRIRRPQPFPTLHWHLRGKPSTLKIRAEHIGSGVLPEAWWNDLARSQVRLIHCNHAFNAGLAEKVRGQLMRRAAPRPPLIIDTHDILAAAPATTNPWTRRADTTERLARDEFDLLKTADLLIQISESDFDYFCANMPTKAHHFVPAVVADPRVRPIEEGEGCDFDFIYVGNANHSNSVSVAWFLRNLGPACRKQRWRVAIVGTIDKLMQETHPHLFDEFRAWFIGEVPEVTPLYEKSKVVIAPSLDGTGSSIKVLECLAAGRALVATPNSFRGFPRAILLPRELAPAGSPSEFLERMRLALQDYHRWGKVGRQIFLEHFTEQHYRARMSNAIERVLSSGVARDVKPCRALASALAADRTPRRAT